MSKLILLLVTATKTNNLNLFYMLLSNKLLTRNCLFKRKKNITLECDGKIKKQICLPSSLTLPDKCLFSLSSNPHKPLRKLFLLLNTWYAASHIFLLESEAKVQIAKSSNLFSLL